MREMRFLRSMHRSECKDPFPQIVSFEMERNDVVTAPIRRAIRHLGRNAKIGEKRGCC